MSTTSTLATASSNPSQSASPAPPGLMNKCLAVIREAIDWLFGYDFFISYSWEDEKVSPYAVPLAQALTTRFKFRTCLDRTEYHAGMDLTQATKRRVRASKVLLLVLRPCAARGSWVLRELEEAIKAGRTIIPVDVDGTFANLPNDLPVRELLKDRLRVRDAHGDNQAEGPSANALAEIRNAFGFIRRDTIKLSVAFGLAALFAVIALLAFWQMREANQQRDVAVARQQAGLAQFQFTQARLLEESLANALGAAESGVKKDLDNPALRWAGAITPVRVFSKQYAQYIRDVSYCADGKALVSAGTDGWLRVHDPQTGEELGKKLGSGKDTMTQVFCGDNWLIGTQDDVVRKWDRETGEQSWQAAASQAAIAIAKRASLVAVLSEDGVQLVDIRSGRETAKISAKSIIQASSRAAISDDGRVLAFTKKPWTVEVHRIAGAHVRRLDPIEIEEEGASVWGLAFDPKSELLAVMALDEANSRNRMTVKVYDLTRKGKQRKVKLLWASSHRLTQNDPDYYPKQVLSFNATGELLLVGSVDGSVRVMDSRTGEEVRRVRHSDSISVNDLAWLPDQRHFASAGLDGKVSVWEALSGREVVRVIHQHNVDAIAVSPDGKHIATASTDNSLRVSETTGAEPETLWLDDVASVSFGASGHYLLTRAWGGEGAARLWESYGASAAEVIPGKKSWAKLLIGAADNLAAGIDSDQNLHVCLSADCIGNLGEQAPFLEGVADVRIAASGNRFAVQTGNEVRVFGRDLRQQAMQPGFPESRFEISPRGNYLLYVNSAELVIYELASQKEVTRVAYSGSIEFCFDPLERWVGIASSENDYPLVPLNATGPSVSTELLIRRTIACHPSGNYVATRGKERKLVEIRSTSTGALVKSLRHANNVLQVLFDTSGESVATSVFGPAPLIHFWHVAGEGAEGEEIARREANDVFNIAFSPGGEYLAAISHGAIEFHRWKPESLLSEAKRRAPGLVGVSQP